MKRNLFIKSLAIVNCLILSSTTTFAQWTTDEENPQLVSAEENNRLDVASQPDGDGGVYVFWKDSRLESSHNDVYGQHYNSDGVALWEENGRAILDYSGSITKYTTYRNALNDELYIASITSGSSSIDSVRVRRLNDDGGPYWEQELAVSQVDPCSPPEYIISLQNIQMVQSNDTYLVVFESTVCGGYTKLFLSQFNEAGELLSPYYGIDIIGGSGYQLQPTFDNSGDFLISYIAYDNGSLAYLARLTDTGEIIFSNINMTYGPEYLGGNYKIVSDEIGITFVYVSNSNIYARKFDMDGNPAWDSETLDICTADGTQDRFDLKQLGENYSVVWQDARPGIVGFYAIYAQRFTTSGDIAWDADGIQVANLNTFSPAPKFAFNSDGEMIVTHISNLTGFTAHKVNNDGNVEWGSNGLLQCTSSFNPAEGDYSLISSGENIIVAWQKANFANEIYISRVYPQLTEVYQDVVACTTYYLNNEIYTETGIYLVELPGDTLLTLDLIIVNVDATVAVDGGTLTDTYVEGNSIWWNCDTNTIMSMGPDSFTPTVTGNYALIIEHGGCIDTSDCYFINVIGVEEWNLSFHISLYPNPVKDILNIQSDFYLQNVDIDVYDSHGKLLLSSTNQSFERFQFDMQTLSCGLYNLSIRDNKKLFSTTFIKE